MTHKELLEEFLIFEEEHRLFELRIEDIPLWEYMRFSVFYQLKNELVASILDTGGKKINGFSKALKTYGNHSFFKNPDKISKDIDLLVFNHARRREAQGVYHDIHTDPFLPGLDMDYAVLENYFNYGHLKPAPTPSLYYLDKIELPAAMARKLSSKKPNNTDLKKLDAIVSHVKEQWDVDLVNFKTDVKKLVRQHKYVYPRIEKLINRIKPKKILTVVSYAITNQIVTEIAHKYGIKVIEAQHGVVGRLHVAYNYKGHPRLMTVPDYFLAWGSYWMEGARMGVPQQNIKLVGFPYLDSFKKGHDAVRHPKQLIFISQMSDKIARFAEELAKHLPTYKILFKAHPSEYEIVHDKYPYLSNQRNISIVADDKKPLYTLFQESRFVFGVYSTALMEAIAFCDAIFVIKYAGWELYENMSSTFNFIGTTEEAIVAIQQNDYKSAGKNTEHYFVPGAIQKTCSFLENL